MTEPKPLPSSAPSPAAPHGHGHDHGHGHPHAHRHDHRHDHGHAHDHAAHGDERRPGASGATRVRPAPSLIRASLAVRLGLALAVSGLIWAGVLWARLPIAG